MSTGEKDVFNFNQYLTIKINSHIEHSFGFTCFVFILQNFDGMDHFTVACLVAWPLNESEAGGDLV